MLVIPPFLLTDPEALRTALATCTPNKNVKFELTPSSFDEMVANDEITQWVRDHADQCTFSWIGEIDIHTHLPTRLGTTPTDNLKDEFFRTWVFPRIPEHAWIRGPLDTILGSREYNAVMVTVECVDVRSLLHSAIQIRERFPSVMQVIGLLKETNRCMKWCCIWQELHNEVPAGWWFQPRHSTTDSDVLDTEGVENEFIGFELRYCYQWYSIRHRGPPVCLALSGGKNRNAEGRFCKLGIRGKFQVRAVVFAADDDNPNLHKDFDSSVQKLIANAPRLFMT